MWWNFSKHRLAAIGGGILGVLYLGAIFCEFFLRSRAAALPVHWSALRIYFGITVIVSLIAGPTWHGWCGASCSACARKTS